MLFPNPCILEIDATPQFGTCLLLTTLGGVFQALILTGRLGFRYHPGIQGWPLPNQTFVADIKRGFRIEWDLAMVA